jgi:uncharacterized protein
MEITERSGGKEMIKHFTHNDLDGVGCAVVSKKILGDGVDVEYCGYENIDEKVVEFFKEKDVKEYDAIFITDISVSEKVAEMIEQVSPENVILLDHHGTAEGLNKYDWATVKTTEYNNEEERNQITSGTSLLFDFLDKKGLVDLDPKTYVDMREFVEKVRRYDSWEWKLVYGDNEAFQLNSLFYLIGRYKFLDRFVPKCNVNFNKTEKTLLEVERNRMDYYIRGKKKEMIKGSFIDDDDNEYHVGVVFAEQYNSELGNILADENPDLDFIIMVNAGARKLSFRRRDGVDVDLGKQIASMYEGDDGKTGGGHPPAAGAPIDSGRMEGIMHLLLEK